MSKSETVFEILQSILQADVTVDRNKREQWHYRSIEFVSYNTNPNIICIRNCLVRALNHVFEKHINVLKGGRWPNVLNFACNSVGRKKLRDFWYRLY